MVPWRCKCRRFFLVASFLAVASMLGKPEALVPAGREPAMEVVFVHGSFAQRQGPYVERNMGSVHKSMTSMGQTPGHKRLEVVSCKNCLNLWLWAP